MTAAIQVHEAWPPPQVAQLAAYVGKGLLVGHIADLSGRSRNAVVGKIKRLGLRSTAAEQALRLASAVSRGDPLALASMSRLSPEAGDDLRRILMNLRSFRAGCSAPRTAQADFRAKVLVNYRHRCCLTDATELAVLEAAHIIPHARGGSSDVDNGLALRADIHQLFDAGLVAIDADELKLRVSNRVRCPAYRALDTTAIRLSAVRAPPSRQALRWHERNIFNA